MLNMAGAEQNVVLGLGNLLNNDEGLGIHALCALQERCEPLARVEWVDGGVLGLSLLPLVDECRRLLVLDAIDAGKPPGTLISLSREAIPLYAGIRLSQHQIDFQEVLGLAKVRGRFPPHLELLGIQPGNLEMGTHLSPPVLSSLPLLLYRAVKVLRSWGLV